MIAVALGFLAGVIATCAALYLGVRFLVFRG